jgi:CheY-like chemotaxis protein
VAELAPILVVDDEANDLLLFRRAASKAGIAHPVETASDGEEAILRLQDAGAPIPLVVVLDLKMPRRTGFEVLEWVRGHAGLRRLPIVIFTSSAQDADVNRAFDLGASSYLVKPVTSAELAEVVTLLASYWGRNPRPALHRGGG